jgi:serine/threonine protein kinase
MQYVDGGNLRQYLKEHFSELSWDDKLKFAYQITEGIKYLHDDDVFHQSLHSKNILIHDKEAKIVFNIAKYDSEISYIDPKILKDVSYEYDKKSDIYSLGVLMWELTSGYPPKTENISKSHIIDHGYRENRIPGTPREYLDLYESCWDPEPGERPPINQVFNKLGKMYYAQTKTNLEPSVLINMIKNNRITKIISINELSKEKSNVDKDTILKATWKETKCLVVLKTIKLNEAIIHELKMHKPLNSCSRFVSILGVGLGKLA